jgi:Zn finger protein HypA/HybF involved in hydrogenase expression
MTRKRKLTSIVWTISRESLQKIINESKSIREILPKLGLSANSAGSFLSLKKRIYGGEFDIQLFEEKRKNNVIGNYSKTNKMKLEDILKENSSYSRKSLKKRLVEEDLLEYKCNKCGNSGEWLGEKLNLQIDHMNGINNDNRLKNLQFLCPNCHSQTHNFGSRNKHRKRIIK